MWAGLANYEHQILQPSMQEPLGSQRETLPSGECSSFQEVRLAKGEIRHLVLGYKT